VYWKQLIDEETRKLSLVDLAKADRMYPVVDALLDQDGVFIKVEFSRDIMVWNCFFPKKFENIEDAISFLGHVELMMNRRMPIGPAGPDWMGIANYESRVMEPKND
jgi:hypothetical protein